MRGGRWSPARLHRKTDFVHATQPLEFATRLPHASALAIRNEFTICPLEWRGNLRPVVAHSRGLQTAAQIMNPTAGVSEVNRPSSDTPDGSVFVAKLSQRLVRLWEVCARLTQAKTDVTHADLMAGSAVLMDDWRGAKAATPMTPDEVHQEFFASAFDAPPDARQIASRTLPRL